jgi:hypothetical protein
MPTTSTAIKKKIVVFVCNTCGSEKVLIDAWAAWNKDNQRWELSDTFDAAFCAECDGECSVVSRAAS